MSLLDDVSIVVTPNGYKAGRLYGVLPVPTEGSEEITNYNLNGNFSDTSALHTWISAFGGSFAPSTGVNDGSIRITSNGGIRLNGIYMGVVVGKLYKVSVLASTNTGTALLNCSGDLTNFTLKQTVTTTPTTFDFYVTYSSYISFFANLTSNILTLDDISVKEWTSSDMDVTRATAATRVDENGLVNYAQVISDTELVTDGDFPLPNVNWTLGGEAEITVEGARIYSSSGGQSYVKQSVLTNTKIYKLTYEIINSTQGSLKLISVNGLSDFPITSTVGTHTVYFTANNNEFFIYRNSGVTDVTIDNVSVKEVTRDNVPRIDYTGGGCPHILAEPQRTNLITYSEDTSQWTDSGITYSVNYIISPDGTLNGSKAIINDTITSSNTRPMTSVAVTSGLNYVFSVFGKADEFDMINLDFSNTAFSTVSVDYNLTNGTVTSFVGSPVSQGVEDYGNGWYRCYVVATAIATTTTALIIRLDDNPTGDGTSGLYLWGAQFEAGSYPTSYIPTSGSTVTRNQDQFTRDGISSLINSTEGVLFAEMSALANDGTFRIISLSDGTGSNRLWLYFTVGSNLIQVFDGTTIMAHTIDVTNMIKVAAVFDSNGTRMWVNGSQVGSNSYVGFSGFDRLNFSSESGSNNFFGKIKQVQVYDTALTDNQLIQLTGEAGTHFFESYSEMAETLTYTIQ